MTLNYKLALRATLTITIAILIKIVFTAEAAFAGHSGALDLAAVSFANQNNGSGDLEAVLNLNYRYETIQKNNSSRWKLAVEGDAFAATYPDFAFAVPEARLFYATKETEASVGRKKIENINFLDEDWYLGVQTAFFRMDPFNPKEQGLTGINYQIKTEEVFLEFFGSPIFVPDQNPGLNVRNDGSVFSDNPWVILPPERLELSTGGVLEIDYSLVEDSVPELLSQYQLGGRFGINLKDLSILGMYYNRPSRQLDFAVTAKVESGEDSGFINVQAKPLFSREHFYGLQVESIWMNKLKVKNGFYGIIQQNNSSADDAKFETSRYDYFFISTGLEYDFSKFKLTLKHLLTNKKQIKEDGIVYFETSRFLFENAVAAELSHLRWKTVYFKIGTVYSYNEKTAQFYLRAEKGFGSGFGVYSSLNLINDFNREDLSSDSTALTPLGMQRYAALDNIRLGVSYVF
jgi:hypothetical protein